MNRNLNGPQTYSPNIFVLRTPSGFGFKLVFNYENDSNSPVVEFTLSEILTQQETLKKYLEEFQEKIEKCRVARISYTKNKEVIKSLRNLAQYSYEIYDYFRNGIKKNSPGLHKLWIQEFENRNWRNNLFEKQLNIYFPFGITFPFGLYFVKDPEQINWEIGKLNIHEIIKYFLDFRAQIINRFHKDEILNGRPLNIENIPLKPNRKSQIYILHGIDDKLEHKLEKDSWKIDKYISPKEIVKTKQDLKSKLLPNKFPRIIHFSSHFYYDEKESLHKLTLSNNDTVTKIDLGRLEKLNTDQNPALFFFNSCDSGISIIGEKTGFIEELYPEFALGFITTMFEVNDKVAGLFANKFYQNFFNGRNLINSIYSSKRELIIDHGMYSVIGYNTWQVNPELRYFGEDYIKKRKLNKKKKLNKS